MRAALIHTLSYAPNPEWTIARTVAIRVLQPKRFLIDAVEAASDEQVRAVYHQYLINLLTGQTQ